MTYDIKLTAVVDSEYHGQVFYRATASARLPEEGTLFHRALSDARGPYDRLMRVSCSGPTAELALARLQKEIG